MRRISGYALAGLVVAGSFGALLQADDKKVTKKPKAEEKQNKSQDQAVRKLIGQLGDNDYATRKKATEELIKIGKPAIDTLKQVARSSKDPEVRWRAESILGKIQAAENLKRPSGDRPGAREFPFPAPRGQMPDEMQKLFRRFRQEMFGPGGQGFRNFSWSTGNGERRLTVNEGGTRYDFTRAKNGSFKITTQKGSDKKSYSFKDEATFKAKQPQLHAIWKRGAGIQIRMLPFGRGGNDELRKLMEKQFRDLFGERFKGLEQFKGMREQLERARKMLRELDKGLGPQVPAPKKKIEPAPRLIHGLACEKASAPLLAQFELTSGVVVTRVSGGLAAKLGLKKHDLIISANGAAVSAPEVLDKTLTAAEGKVELVVLRRGVKQTLEASGK